MKIEYTKSYRSKDFNDFSLYNDLSFKTTNVFYEYYNLIIDNNSKNREELIECIKNYIKKSRSKIEISYTDDGIEFFKPNKYVFPEMYIIFK